MTPHTPGKLTLHPTREWPILVPVDDLGIPVAKVDCSVSDTNRPYAEARANAERLAHCWNCHEELVDALMEIRDCVCLPSGTSLKTQRSFRDIAHDAITKAGRKEVK